MARSKKAAITIVPQDFKKLKSATPSGLDALPLINGMIFVLLLCSAVWLFMRGRARKRLTFDGYVLSVPLWGRTKYEHREIAEEILGRKLRPNEVVHHINGKPRDNRPHNLCVMDRDDHDAYHEWYRSVYRGLGKYPRRETQLRWLREKFSGTLLADLLDRRRRSG